MRADCRKGAVMKAPGVFDQKPPITPKICPLGKRYQTEPVQQSIAGRQKNTACHAVSRHNGVMTRPRRKKMMPFLAIPAICSIHRETRELRICWQECTGGS